MRRCRSRFGRRRGQHLSGTEQNLERSAYRIASVAGTYYMTMLETAELVAKRYGVNRVAQDEYALESQKRTAYAQSTGYFDNEAVPMFTVKSITNRSTGESSEEPLTLKQDECNRPGTTFEDLSALAPVMGDGHVVTAGNASQMSDGASACIIMSDAEAA